MTSNMRWAIMLMLTFATLRGPALAQPALISSASQINLHDSQDDAKFETQSLDTLPVEPYWVTAFRAPAAQAVVSYNFN